MCMQSKPTDSEKNSSPILRARSFSDNSNQPRTNALCIKAAIGGLPKTYDTIIPCPCHRLPCVSSAKRIQNPPLLNYLCCGLRRVESRQNQSSPPWPSTLDFASAGPVTKRSRLVVDHYWFKKEQYRIGQWIKSTPFKAGDCSWCIYYYPNGRSTSSADYISILIALAGTSAAGRATDEPVKARVRFSLLDRAGEPVPDHSLSSGVWEWEYPRVGHEHGCSQFIHKEFLEASEYLVDDDRFTVECVVSVERPYELQQRLSLDPDVTFQVSGEAFSVHSCVLAAKSPVLEAELARQSTSAAGACSIRIDDMLPQVFKSMLHFVYTDSLPETTTRPEEESVMGEHLLVAADRFGMQELKVICEEILTSDINVNTVTKKLRQAIQYQCHMLRDACIEFLGDPPVLEAVMAIDDDILELVAKNCPLLLKEMWAYEDDPMQDELAMCF